MNRHFVRAILKLIQWYVGSIINIDPIAAIVCSFYCRAANTTHIPRGESFHFCLWLCLCMESMLSMLCTCVCAVYGAQKSFLCWGLWGLLFYHTLCGVWPARSTAFSVWRATKNSEHGWDTRIQLDEISPCFRRADLTRRNGKEVIFEDGERLLAQATW